METCVLSQFWWVPYGIVQIIVTHVYCFIIKISVTEMKKILILAKNACVFKMRFWEEDLTIPNFSSLRQILHNFTDSKDFSSLKGS